MTPNDKGLEAASRAYCKVIGLAYDDLSPVLAVKRDEAMRAAITAYQAEAWQPIETAPKERGAKILGWCVYPAGAEVRLCQNAPAYTSAPGSTRWEAYGMAQQVTHWQPLPPAPKATPARSQP